MAQSLEDVYCTLLMSDSYLPGAAVLAHSLRDAGTTKKLAVLVTLETLSADTITQLKALYDYVIPVERIRSPNLANLYLMGRPDLSYAFTKIALWRQTRFRKIVYLDADVVALQALDELFDVESPFAAAPDIGWPDAFNSGVMVLTPDMGEYWALHTLASSGDSFDGADQGLLNQYYENRPWQRLKFTYNTTPNAEYQWEPAYQYYKKDIKAVHFIGKTKPWSEQHSGRLSGSGVYNELLAHWWAVHDRHAQNLDPPAPVLSAEPLTTDSHEHAKHIDQGAIEPTPTAHLPEFSVPQMQWDATRFEPPAQSKPEAANFPTQTYTFSDSHELFKAPTSYPDPPKDMWYKVPESKPKPIETLNPIFPWEQQPNRTKATRVFAEDLPPEPAATSSPTHAFSTVHYKDDDSTAARATSPGQSSTPSATDNSWQSFQQSNINAWDNVPGIDNYVRAIMDSQSKKGKTQVLRNATGTQDISSPVLERGNRRESLILTDFPSAVERPSLPVTPAPQKRPMFWGEERKELPAATGVPDQTEWDPEEKLEQLRRSSLIEFEHLKNDEHPNPPLRTLPEELSQVNDSADSKSVSKSHSTGNPARLFRSGFSMADFGTEFSRRQTDVTSPIATRDFAEQGNQKRSFPKLNDPNTNVTKLDVDKKDTPIQSANAEKKNDQSVTPGNEETVRSTEKAENADPNEKNVSADQEEVAKPSTSKQGITKPSEVVERDVTDRGAPEIEAAYKDVAEKYVSKRDVGLERGVARENTAAEKVAAEPKAVTVEDDTRKDITEKVVEKDFATKQHPIVQQSDAGDAAGKPAAKLSSSDNVAKPSSSSPQEKDKSVTIVQQRPAGQESTTSSPEATEEVGAKQEELSSPAPREVSQQESTTSSSPAQQVSTSKIVDKQPSVTEEKSVPEDSVGRAWEEESGKQSFSASQQRPAQQGSTSYDNSTQPYSIQQASSSAEGKHDTSLDGENRDVSSSLLKATDKQAEPAGLFSSVTSPESSKSQLSLTGSFTSAPEKTPTLSGFVEAGQNLVGLGITEHQQGVSGDFPLRHDISVLEKPYPEQGSTISGSTQTRKDFVGLGTDEYEHKPSSGFSSTSDRSISHVPALRQDSKTTGFDKSADISAEGIPRGQYSSQYDSSKGSGLFSPSTSHQSFSGSPSLSSSERLSQQHGHDFKYSEPIRTGGDTSGGSSYTPSSLRGAQDQFSSSRPYSSSSYTSQLERLYGSSSASGSPTVDRFYSTSTERYPSLSGRPSLPSLYGTTTSPASPPLPSYSSHFTSTSRPSSIYSELPSLSSHHTSTSRPSSYYGVSTSERPSSIYGGGISTIERPSSRHSSVVSITDRPSSPYSGGTSIIERPSSLYSSTPSTERLSSLYGGTLTSHQISSSSSQHTTSLSHSHLHSPSSFSSTSTYKPYSSSSATYPSSRGRSTMHEPTAMHHSLSPSPSLDQGSASRLSHVSHSTAGYGTHSFSPGNTAPLEYSSTRHDYSSSYVPSFSHRLSSSKFAQTEVSATDLSSSLMGGTYTQQILTGQTRLHVPGFEEDTFNVPDKDRIEKSIEPGEVKFSRDSEEKRGGQMY